MMYHVMIQRGQGVPLTDEAKEIFRSEAYGFAKDAADNHKARTGENCFIESRTVIYVTQTLDEAMATGADMPDSVVVYQRDTATGDFNNAKNFRSARQFATALDQAKADRRHVQVGDHPGELRRR